MPMSSTKMNVLLVVAACATGYAFIKASSYISRSYKENTTIVNDTITPSINNVDPRKRFFNDEFDTIKDAAIRNNLDPNTQLFSLLLAIRRAENGRAGREFGVLHPRAVNTNLDVQAGWASATVVKNYDRWLNEDNTNRNFFEFLGSKYAPVGADNDQDNLNQHWVANVEFWFGVLENGINNLDENMPWTPVSKEYAKKFDLPVIAELYK